MSLAALFDALASLATRLGPELCCEPMSHHGPEPAPEHAEHAPRLNSVSMGSEQLPAYCNPEVQKRQISMDLLPGFGDHPDRPTSEPPCEPLACDCSGKGPKKQSPMVRFIATVASPNVRPATPTLEPPISPHRQKSPAQGCSRHTMTEFRPTNCIPHVALFRVADTHILTASQNKPALKTRVIAGSR